MKQLQLLINANRPRGCWPQVSGNLIYQACTINFRVARQNEAARRRTLRVRLGSGGCLTAEISLGHKEAPCDPFTQNDAGGTPAS
jgi:hypothetical protein